MRGIPGSGKSTKARELAGTSGRIHSTDDFFLDSQGNYRHNANTARRNHFKNFEAFVESLCAGVTPVICDNSNVRLWEFAEYAKAAKEHGYAVTVVTMPSISVQEALSRNIHNVPRGVLERMHDSFEHEPHPTH